MDIAVTPLTDADGEHAYDIWRRSSLHDIPDFPGTPRRWFFAGLRRDRPGRRTVRLLARLDGTPAGYAELHLPQRDNPQLALLDLFVEPTLRRNGVGRALHAHATELALADGRRTLVAVTVARELPDGGGAPHDGAGASFAEAMGAEPALPEVRRRLDIPTLDTDALAGLHATARAAATGYEVVFWPNEAPAEYLGDLAYLEGRLLQDAPTGDLDVEPERPDATAIRELEADMNARGRTAFNAGIRHGDRLVAWTAIVQDDGVDWHCWQGITLVDPPHRGHRLGLLVKLENLRRVLAARPSVTAIDTWNAAANRHMIAINEAIGFRAVDGFVQWQQKL